MLISNFLTDHLHYKQSPMMHVQLNTGTKQKKVFVLNEDLQSDI